MLLATRSGANTPDPGMMSVSARPAANGGPMRPSASPRNVARAAFACFSLGVLLSGNDRPPASTSRTGPLRAAVRTSAAYRATSPSGSLVQPHGSGVPWTSAV